MATAFVKTHFLHPEGRCHEVATISVINDNPDSELVVGRYCGFLGHSWVMKDDRVYDPTQNLEMSWDEYRITQHAEIFRKYTAEQAREWLARTGHYPPWEEVDRYNRFVMGSYEFAMPS